MASNQSENAPFIVLVNEEEQYALWPAHKKELPPGWKATQIEGDKETCKSHVKHIWTDMRPKSLRQTAQ